MKHLQILFFLVMASSSLFAVPRFAMMEGVNCVTCHNYQGGGGSRNAYGKEYAQESMVKYDFRLPWSNEENLESEFPVTFGLDTRYQMIAQPDKDLRQFPMQFALYANAERGGFISHFELGRVLDELRFTGGLRYEGLPLESWISVSHELPVMGWRIDDHSVFTRGGNLTVVGLELEGMPYTPFIEPPSLIEVGMSPIIGLELSGMTGTGFIGTALDKGSTTFNAVKANYLFMGNWMTGYAGFAMLNEDQNISARVVTWGLGAADFVLLGEWSQMEGWPQSQSSNLAVMHQLSYRIFRGLDVVGRYEFFDPDISLQNGAIQRSSFGLEIFPTTGVELKISYRKSQLDIPELTPDPESQILSQIHIYL